MTKREKRLLPCMRELPHIAQSGHEILAYRSLLVHITYEAQERRDKRREFRKLSGTWLLPWYTFPSEGQDVT